MTEVAKRSSTTLDKLRAKSEELNDKLADQNGTLAQHEREAVEAKDAASKASGGVTEARSQLDRLSKESLEAFKHAFALEHKHGESKKAYEDAVVEANMASERWEHEQRQANQAQFNVSRLAAMKMRYDW